jgi:5'-3' exonuclease
MKTLLVDSSYLTYRSYFAFPNFRTDGKHTGAIYGYIRAVLSIVAEYHIERIVFALDLPGKTWRHETYDGYKAGRPPMDDSMREQIPVVQDWSRDVSPYVLSQVGYEADDMICSVIETQPENEYFILSSDRDLYQLFTNSNVTVLKGKTGGYTEYGASEFTQEFGIKPEQYTDYKALVGDGSDNIKGVPGIGPKTASKLLQFIGSLKKLYEVMNWTVPECFKTHSLSIDPTEFITNPKNLDLLSKIYDNTESLELAYRLSTLHCVEVEVGDVGFDFDKGYHVYEEYQFKSLLKKTSDKKPKPIDPVEDGALF